MGFLRSIFTKPVDAQVLDSDPFTDRVMNFVSLILGVFGTIVAGWSVVTPTLPPWLLLFKDLAIFLSLLVLVLFFFVRYRYAAGQYERQRLQYTQDLDDLRRLLVQQIESFQRLMSATRESFYENVGPSIYEQRFRYVTPGLQESLYRSMDQVISAVRKMIESDFQARWPRKPIGMSISVKAYVTAEMVRELCTLTDEQSRRLQPGRKYVITLDRDHETRLQYPQREVRRAFFEIEQNTDFSRIESGELQDFECNDLLEQYKAMKYKNNSPDWKLYYNASQVVPIWNTNGSKPYIFGYLTVDSPNHAALPLFNTTSTLAIMRLGADLLALLFLALDLYDHLPRRPA